jgi:EAL domain-containing protein (putative c-di-GMP-specific phosphodiesterase class I)
MVMQDMKHAVLLMTQLRKLGIKLDMDDFGTGYSSLSYLHQLPLDTIKIDKSFISRIQYNLRDSAIVNAILGISRSLEMDVVAEGIETATQAQVLRESSCTYGQGYFFNRPLNVTQATEVLKNSILYDI